MKKFFNCKGETLIELVLAMGLAALIFPALLGAFMSTREGKAQENVRMQAVALLKETEQAVKSVRSNGWNTFINVTMDSPYHPLIASSKWSLASGTQTSNGLTQSVVISNVSRNSNGDIVMSGGTDDPSTKKVTITISWTQPFTSSITSTTYYTRSADATYANTKDTDFSPGTLSNTQVTKSVDGEVLLANNNKGKWCSPSFSNTTIDLPDGPPVAVAATASATSVHIPNDVFVATAPNTSSTDKMAYLEVAADTDSPIATQEGVFTMDSSQYSAGTFPSGTGLDNNFKTNDIKYYKSSGGKLYALLATNLPEKEVVAVQVDNGNGLRNAYQDSTNKIYKYWTYFNTSIYSGATATTGYLNPTANAAETTNAGDNDGYGSNPTRAYTSDNSFAVDTNSGSGTGTNCDGTDKDKHRYYNYNIYMPSYAAISGIEVQLKGKVDSTTANPVMCVELSWDGGTTWTTAKTTSTLTTSNATYTLGTPSDTWGHTWSSSDLSNANFRVRVIDVSSDTSRDFSLDWVGVKIDSNSSGNDYDAFGYGANSIAILGNTGYVAEGGYMYVFDLSNIDSKSPSTPLDMVGCRIELDGYECKPGTGQDAKYNTGETGATWSNTTAPAHNDCSDGGNVELYADEDLAPVKVGANTYVYVAVGAATNPEFEIANVTSVPTGASSPTISNSSCGAITGGNASWKMGGSLDFNPISGTEESANSVYAKSDGSRAYVSSNGGIDANNDGKPDSYQMYVIDTTTKTAPKFLSTNADGTAKSGYYYASGADGQMYPRRSQTVQDGVRAVLVGKDGVADSNNAHEYQVSDMTTEASPTECGSLDFNSGFNDLTSVSELDGDNYMYMVANTQTNELKIIQGGPDNAIYVASGTYESPTYDAGASSAFNNFTATVTQPSNTTIKMQVAVAPTVGGSCTNAVFSYVGPGGDPAQYFTPSGGIISGTIPYGNYQSNAYQNPGRCYRYKVWMSTTDQTQTPTLYDFTANYSP